MSGSPDQPAKGINWGTVMAAMIGPLIAAGGVVYVYGGDHKQLEVTVERVARLEEVGSPAIRMYDAKMEDLKAREVADEVLLRSIPAAIASLQTEVAGLRRDVERLERAGKP